MRRTVIVAVATAGLLLSSAAPAWAVNALLEALGFSHVADESPTAFSTQASGNKMRVTGKLKLDSSQNPEVLPEGAKKCVKRRAMEVQKKSASGWNTFANVKTNRRGKLDALIPHKHGTFRVFIPRSFVNEGTLECYEETSKTKKHQH